MGVDHSSILTFSTVLTPSPPARAGFGLPLLLVPLATNTLGAGSGTTDVKYASATEAQTARTASQISAATMDRINVLFAQTPRPQGIVVASVDLVGGEDYGEAFVRVAARRNDFYFVAIDSRTDSEIAVAAAAVESNGTKQLLAVSASSSWLDSGVPTDYSAITGYNRTSIIYHDVSTAYADMALLGGRLAWDPDSQSVDWKQNLVSVANLTGHLTAAQRAFIVDTNKANVGLPWGSQTNFLFPGQAISGRPIYEIFSADWFRTRVQEDIGDLYSRNAAAGRKLIVGAEGQASVLAILNQRLLQGERGNHFSKGQTRATALAVTQDDLNNKRLRFTAEAQAAQSANALRVDFYLQNSPLAEVA